MISFSSSALEKYPAFTLGVTTHTGGNVSAPTVALLQELPVSL